MTATPEHDPNDFTDVVFTPDPYGDRVCHRRWEHRESTLNVEYGGEQWCGLCYTKDADGVHLIEPPTS